MHGAGRQKKQSPLIMPPHLKLQNDPFFRMFWHAYQLCRQGRLQGPLHLQEDREGTIHQYLILMCKCLLNFLNSLCQKSAELFEQTI
jgi:hypothetical protein